jgi:hypothetical protein
MMLYAELPGRRLRQVLLDIGSVLWIALWVRVGLGLFRVIDRLESVGRTMQEAGHGFASTMDRVAGDIGRVPVAGGTLRAPFRDAAGAGQSLEGAGVNQTQVVHSVALWLGILVALLPILWLLVRYLPNRLRWIREASAARRLLDASADLHLFALRAVANRPLADLRRAEADPMAAIAGGDYRQLAELELRELGLRAVIS